MRSEVNGTCRMRAPVASKMAFPIALPTTVMAVSPAPVAGTSGRVQEYHFDFRDGEAEGERVIRSPVDRGHVVVVPSNLFAEGAAQALQRPAFALVAEAVGIRDRSGIDADDDSFHGKLPCCQFNFDSSDHGRVTVISFVGNAGDAAPAGDACR